MSRFPRRNTLPELAIRRLLHAQGLRYRLNLPVPGNRRRTIDIAFPRRKLAVFVDGCFWHGCPEHGKVPSSNHAWWTEKVRRNRERDMDTVAHLQRLGWQVLRVWEHLPPQQVASTVRERLSSIVAPDPNWAGSTTRRHNTGGPVAATNIQAIGDPPESGDR